MTARPRHSAKPTRVQPHPFDADPDVPPNFKEQQYCRRCRCAGQAGDARHPLPVAPHDLPPVPAEARALEARMLGEDPDE